MHKRAKNNLSQRKRKNIKKAKGRFVFIAFFTGVFLLVLAAQPLYHVFQIRAAEDRFDLIRLDQELSWVNEKVSWLDKIPLVRNSELWLNLNQGKTLSDQELLTNLDDKHRFWFVQLKLRSREFTEAGEMLTQIESPSIQSLGRGLLDLAQGKYDSALEQLNAAQDSKLSHEDQVLKVVALSHRLLAIGDLSGAKKEWERAKNIAPNHPLVLEEEFNLSLSGNDWQTAEKLLPQVEKFQGNGQRPEFQAKKALLYLTLGQTTEWEAILHRLSQTPEASPYQTYLLALKDYQSNDWQAAKEKLESPLISQLSSPFQQDAQQALVLADERLRAESALRKYH